MDCLNVEGLRHAGHYQSQAYKCRNGSQFDRDRELSSARADSLGLKSALSVQLSEVVVLNNDSSQASLTVHTSTPSPQIPSEPIDWKPASARRTIGRKDDGSHTIVNVTNVDCFPTVTPHELSYL